MAVKGLNGNYNFWLLICTIMINDLSPSLAFSSNSFRCYNGAIRTDRRRRFFVALCAHWEWETSAVRQRSWEPNERRWRDKNHLSTNESFFSPFDQFDSSSIQNHFSIYYRSLLHLSKLTLFAISFVRNWHFFHHRGQKKVDKGFDNDGEILSALSQLLPMDAKCENFLSSE